VTARQDALADVVGLIRQNGFTPEEISAALAGGAAAREARSAGMLTKIFGYIGGIFVFAGLCVFIGMHWDEIGAPGRIMLTLGVGFCLFVMGVTAARHERLERAATPLFLMAALLEPTGILVALKEYARGGDPANGLLFMNFVMLAQQGLAFTALRRTFLAFSSIVFGATMCAIALDLLHVSHDLEGLVLGLSLMCLAWALGNSPHRAIAGVTYFTGGAIFLEAAWDWLHRSPAEILFLGLACGMIFVSAAARSRALLALGTLATIAYIGYFTEEHFRNSNGWPFVLMLMGFALIGLSALAVRINRKYISRK
jgi:hypothetical protein